MNKYDMSEFLECCISSCTPSGDGKLDTCNIKKLKIGIKKFAIKHKKDIMELFAFSENNQFGTEDQKQFEKGNGKTFKFDFDKEESEETAEDGKTSGRTVRRLDAGTSIDFTA